MPKNNYYIWLLDRIDMLQERYSNRSLLLQHLFNTDYIFTLKEDEDRAEGGKNLRTMYSMEEGIFMEDIKIGPCSVLEMLVKLSSDLTENAGRNDWYWFLTLLNNLSIDYYTDTIYDEEDIDDKLYFWMNRQYDRDGHGNIFKLKDNNGLDMRDMSTWSQMNAYLNQLYSVPEGLFNKSY